jgi:hypothetical protein
VSGGSSRALSRGWQARLSSSTRRRNRGVGKSDPTTDRSPRFPKSSATLHKRVDLSRDFLGLYSVAKVERIQPRLQRGGCERGIFVAMSTECSGLILAGVSRRCVQRL